MPPELRVASVPAGHPYVRGLGLETVGVRVLEDPRPPGAPPGRWWPPVMLDPAWIADHAANFELLHLHFGFESLTVGELEHVLGALRRAGRPLVHTVHDLAHPQLSDQAHHAAQLDLLLPRADALITLTQGAAAEIEARWGRTATVIPHPAMLAADDPTTAPGGAPARTGPLRIGVHLRDLRPNIDGPTTVRALVAALAELDRAGVPAEGRVIRFDHARDADAAAEIDRSVATHPHLHGVIRARGSDAELVAELLDLDVSLLPYRHGTHSGWAELCWDLGLSLVGRPVGHLADQHADLGWYWPVADLENPAALARAIERAAAGTRNDRPARIARRRRLRALRAYRIAEAHRALYASLR